MKCERPIYNLETKQWEVWDFAYVEHGKRYHELHTFWTFKEALDFWKQINYLPKTKTK